MDQTANNKYYSKQKPLKCPQCDNDKIADILYGLPEFNMELKKRLDNREVTLGGCYTDTDEQGESVKPQWICSECKVDIYRLR